MYPFSGPHFTPVNEIEDELQRSKKTIQSQDNCMFSSMCCLFAMFSTCLNVGNNNSNTWHGVTSRIWASLRFIHVPFTIRDL